MYVVRLFSNQISSSLTSSFPESVIQLNLGLLNGPANYQLACEWSRSVALAH
jgi:hypothetical protein